MNHVFNVILTSSLWDDTKLDRLNALPWYSGERGLVSCDYDKPRSAWYGGSKYLEMNIWIGAFGSLDVGALVAAIRQIEWEEPECVRLYVSQGERGRFVRVDWQEQGQ